MQSDHSTMENIHNYQLKSFQHFLRIAWHEKSQTIISTTFKNCKNFCSFDLQKNRKADHALSLCSFDKLKTKQNKKTENKIN